MLKRVFTAFAVILLLTGCSTGFHRVPAVKHLDRLAAEAKTPRNTRLAKAPAKLAFSLNFERMRGPEDFRYEPRFDWNKKNKKLLLLYAEKFVKLGTVSDYCFISDAQGASLPVSEILARAKEKDADTLLTINAVTMVNWYFNPSVILDPTLLGAIWVPGSNRDVLVIVRADLWDVPSGNPLLTVAAEQIEKIQDPTLVINTCQAMDPARHKILKHVIMKLHRYMLKQCPTN